MKIEVGKFYKTRNGQKAQVFMLNSGNRTHPVLGAILNPTDGEWDCETWAAEGSYTECSKQDSLDLVSEWSDPPKTVTQDLWVKLWVSGDMSAGPAKYGPENTGLIGQRKITVEVTEGEGME